MSTYEIISIVALSIPAVLTVTGWVSPSTLNRRRLLQYSEILSNLPDGYERNRWLVIVNNQSEQARLAMRKRIDSDDVMAFISLVLAIVIVAGMAFSEEFRAIFQEAHPILRYIPVAMFAGLNFLVVRTWIRRSNEKRSELLHEEKENKRRDKSESASQ